MRTRLPLGVKLRDLRIDNDLTIKELSEKTGISKSSLGDYESIDDSNMKSIDMFSLITLAKFYGVSTDYLLGLEDNLKHKNTDISDLHLSDDAIDELKSGKFNNHLLCDIITHPDFLELIEKCEIYVMGQVSQQINMINAHVLLLRTQMEILRRNSRPQSDRGIYEKAADEMFIDETDYFSYQTRDALMHILTDLREEHIKEPENLQFDEKSVFPKMSDEELKDYYAHINAYISGKDPSEFKLDLTNLKKSFTLDQFNIAEDALSDEEFDFLYNILLRSPYTYKFSRKHKKRDSLSKKDSSK